MANYDLCPVSASDADLESLLHPTDDDSDAPNNVQLSETVRQLRDVPLCSAHTLAEKSISLTLWPLLASFAQQRASFLMI